MDNKFTEALDALCEKFGLAIDWTKENVQPYHIPEYYMYEAERMDNGEMVRGYLCKWHNKLAVQDYLKTNGEIFNVKPETVRRVKMPVKRERTPVGDYRCPNCNAAFIEGLEETPFCGNCGMGIVFPETEEEK